MKKFLTARLLKNVNIIDFKNTYIERGASIGEGTIIYPNNYIKSGAVVGKNCTLFSSNFIEDCVLGDEVKVGPCAHIRSGTKIENNAEIGNFCEIKASFIGKNTKIKHLSYIGDSEVGQNCNIGCGVVTANFNGKIKQKTIIGEGTFVGSNASLIAPLKLGQGCYICAGATVDKDMNNYTFYKQNRDGFEAIRKSKKVD